MLVQMSGIPGTGKSTLAARLGERLGYVVLDTDVVKSALLRSGIPLEQSGRATYAATLDVAAHLLAQGQSVILDSPCRYPELLDAGQQRPPSMPECPTGSSSSGSTMSHWCFPARMLGRLGSPRSHPPRGHPRGGSGRRART
ncbi:AAA family ATPase [Nocardioides zhouii]|uniref:AAA family ATPase n=1 Tax=Nocardioides zhouii TaxID=1168729 RepID=UPI0013EB17AB|nr:AAA family ATPase [Nocardioides zhouii]